MKVDYTLELPSENELANLPKYAKSAFNAYCLELIKVIKTDYSSIISKNVLKDTQFCLELIARGLFDSAPSPYLIDSLKFELLKAKSAKEEKREYVRTNIHGANTQSFFYDIPLQVATTALEAVRNDVFKVLTNTISAFRAQAIFSCDGDPDGAVMYEVESTMEWIVPEICKAYNYVCKQPENENIKGYTYFPSDFITQIKKSQYVQKNPEQINLQLKNQDIGVKENQNGFGETILESNPLKSSPLSSIQNSFQFQIFLSFKNLGERGERTEDSLLAEDLFQFFTKKGLKVFYSNDSIESLGISEFQIAIDKALESSQILIVVSTSIEHLSSRWVRYEYSSFQNDILTGIKPSGSVITYVKNLEINKLPRMLRQGQVFFSERGEKEKLFNFCKNAL